MKSKTVKGNWSLRTNKLSFPYVFLVCIFFFFAGFFGFTLFSHSQGDGHSLRPRPRLLESTEVEYNLMPVGELGDDSITSIPFQACAFNILCYAVGQRYNSHYDAFNLIEYGPQKSQRMASFLLYLTDVQEGGETMFPFENGLNMDGNYGYEDCIGLRVKPRQGDGLLFYSLLPNGTIDPTSLHGSCPVIKGEKWVATKWIRDQEQDD
uniref:Prolyl 4-hydroxylase subunit alpha-1 n=1 Tax=Cajanus cajan TaxID=3821 RepID=A0A151TWR9_CAJCA|nr:Prolyl 4-hydroxylase subunit alpha-1 [Cajanus cajan]